MSDAPVLLHATCVAWEGRAVLIRGVSGAGKSALGLELMAGGCGLVADDRTELWAGEGRLVARCPPAIRGLIEARGVGILRAEAVEEAEVVVVADLDEAERERLPPWRSVTLLDVTVPLLRKPLNGTFGGPILQFLKAGRAGPAPPRTP